MNLKHVALQLCTCTWIEIMTGTGITLYMLYLQDYSLAALTAGMFAPLMGFHITIKKLSKDKANWGRGRLIRIRPSKYKLVD
jgi:hypothetical protein